MYRSISAMGWPIPALQDLKPIPTVTFRHCIWKLCIGHTDWKIPGHKLLQIAILSYIDRENCQCQFRRVRQESFRILSRYSILLLFDQIVHRFLLSVVLKTYHHRFLFVFISYYFDIIITFKLNYCYILINLMKIMTFFVMLFSKIRIILL